MLKNMFGLLLMSIGTLLMGWGMRMVDDPEFKKQVRAYVHKNIGW